MRTHESKDQGLGGDSDARKRRDRRRLNRITVSGISDELLAQLESFAEAAGPAGKSQIVRDALLLYLGQQMPNRTNDERGVWNGIASRVRARSIDWSKVAM